jgi:hypothetical protein
MQQDQGSSGASPPAPPATSTTEALVPESRVAALVERLADAAIERGMAKLEAPRTALRMGRVVHHVTRRRLDDAIVCELALVSAVDDEEGAIDLAVWTGVEWQAQRHVEHGADRGDWHWPGECARRA